MELHKNLRKIVIIFCMCISVLPLYAGGNTEAPELEMSTSGIQYLSPNDDGTQDTAKMSFKVTLYVKSDSGFVPGYGMKIQDKNQQIVREIKYGDSSDIDWFSSIFRGYDAFTVDKEIEWDGKDEDGKVVSDGTYDVLIWVIDQDNNKQELEIDDFVVDTVAPTLTVTAPSNLSFSPNGDGNQDTITVSQKSGSTEVLWQAIVLDATGDTVKSYKWENKAPTDFTWDGKNDSGSLAVDGVYKYTVASTDLAGNSSTTYEVADMVLSTVKTPVTLKITPQYFSPNNDGINEQVAINLEKTVTTDITSWQVTVADNSGTTVQQYSGTGDATGDLIFTGKDSSGQILAEGTYQVSYSVLYKYGNQPTGTGNIVLDVTAPVITVKSADSSFSPNQDGVKDTLQCEISSSEQVTVAVTIKDSTGTEKYKAETGGTETIEAAWNGVDTGGKLLAEGEYYLDVVFTDLAGNTYSLFDRKINLDLTPPQVTLTTDNDAFSPNNDGYLDQMSIQVQSNETITGKIIIIDSSLLTVRTFNITEKSTTLSWEGKNDADTLLKDGTYTLRAEFFDSAGNKTQTDPLNVVIDYSLSEMQLLVDSGFSPNADGVDDVLDIAIQTSKRQNVQTWQLDIENQAAFVVRTLTGTDLLPANVSWDGLVGSSDQDLVPGEQGKYKAKIKVEYTSGNISQAVSKTFLLDTTPPLVSLTTTGDPLVQTETGVEGEVFITILVEDESEIVEWNMDILDSNKNIVRSFSGEGDPSDQIMWKGEEDEGRSTTATGDYTLVINVKDAQGNVTTFTDTIIPDILLARKGDKLYLLVDNIIFGAYQHKLDSAGKEKHTDNLASIDKVIKIMNTYPNFSIELEGHALNIYRGDAGAEAKEEKILYPLTERRAKTVKDALTDGGVPEENVTTSAFGGKYPIASVIDWSVNWKNRRVEFILIKE